MKKRFALILILWSSLVSTGSAQSVQDVKTYDWLEVQSANPDTIFGISFEKSKLTEVPAELARFTQLKHINLSKNKLTDLPAFFAQFDSLQHLDLTKNELSTLPIEICQLKSLKDLLIGRNDIASLPDCMEYVSNLEYLDLIDNPISSFPQSMMRLEKLKKIDFTGIRFNKDFQKRWTEQLPNTELIFDSPCDCMN